MVEFISKFLNVESIELLLFHFIFFQYKITVTKNTMTMLKPFKAIKNVEKSKMSKNKIKLYLVVCQ